jgi:hypothetical protein
VGGDTLSFSFNCPTDPDNDPLHFQVEIDDDTDFSSVIIDHDSRPGASGGDGVSGCYYFSGTIWEQYPVTGVPSAYYGNRIAYIFSSGSISRGTAYFCRYRVHDGTSWSDYAGEVKTW